MDIHLEGIVVIVGNYGSGKTEVAINLAANRKRAGMDVRIADLDLVNPYFRTREARHRLSGLGIDVVLPPAQYLNADLPILTPLVSGMIRNPGQLAILDVGGDGVGATVLAALAESFRGQKSRMLQVVNPYRPFTDTVAGCRDMRRAIEKASKLVVGGLVGNANLIDDTTEKELYRGYDFMQTLSRETGLPLEFITVDRRFMANIDQDRFACAVLPIERQLVPPWKTAAAFGDS